MPVCPTSSQLAKGVGSPFCHPTSTGKSLTSCPWPTSLAYTRPSITATKQRKGPKQSSITWPTASAYSQSSNLNNFWGTSFCGRESWVSGGIRVKVVSKMMSSEYTGTSKGQTFGFAEPDNRLRECEDTSEKYWSGCVDNKVDMAIFKASIASSRQCTKPSSPSRRPIYLGAIFWRKWSWGSTTKIGKNAWDNCAMFWTSMSSTTCLSYTSSSKNRNWLPSAMLSAGFWLCSRKDCLFRCWIDYGHSSFSRDGRSSSNSQSPCFAYFNGRFYRSLEESWDNF